MGLRSWADGALNPQSGLIALLALVVGLGNTTCQVVESLRRTEASLLSPSFIILRPVAYTDDERYVHLSVPMRYVHQGPLSKRTVVIREDLKYEVGGVALEHTWENFVEYGLEDDSCELRVEDRLPEPVVMSGDHAVAHLTEFSGKNNDPSNLLENLQAWEDLGTGLAVDGKLDVTLTAVLLDGRELESRCQAWFSEDMRNYFKVGCPIRIACHPPKAQG